MPRVCTGEKPNRRGLAGRKEGNSAREKPLIRGALQTESAESETEKNLALSP